MLDPGSGNTSEALNLESRINDTAQDSIPGMQRCCMATSIGGTVCPNAGTYGSVGALGEKSPRATWPDADYDCPKK